MQKDMKMNGHASSATETPVSFVDTPWRVGMVPQRATKSTLETTDFIKTHNTMAVLADVWSTIKAYQGIISLVVFVFGPGLLPRVVALFTKQPNRPASAPVSSLAYVVVALHFVYAVHELLNPPYNVFGRGLKVLAPRSEVRPRLFKEAGLSPSAPEGTHPLLDLLVAKLSNYNGRMAYVRWGHDVVLQCAWCKNDADYLLASIPSVLSPYVTEAVLLGALGWEWVVGIGANMRKERWRGLAGWALFGLAAADLGARWWWEVYGIDGDALHLSSELHRVRTVLLFLLTAAYVLLPARPAGEDAILLRRLESAWNTLNLTAVVRAAAARSPALVRMKEDQRALRVRAEEKARHDANVVKIAQDVGMLQGNDFPREEREGARRFLMTKWSTAMPDIAAHGDGGGHEHGPGCNHDHGNDGHDHEGHSH